MRYCDEDILKEAFEKFEIAWDSTTAAAILAEKIIVVEGLTEILCFPEILSRFNSTPDCDFSIISANGKQQMLNFLELLSYLEKDILVIIDNDAGKPPSERNNKHVCSFFDISVFEIERDVVGYLYIETPSGCLMVFEQNFEFSLRADIANYCAGEEVKDYSPQCFKEAADKFSSKPEQVCYALNLILSQYEEYVPDYFYEIMGFLNGIE